MRKLLREINNPDIKRFFGSFMFCQLVFYGTAFCIMITNDRLPDRQKYPPLPDIVLDNIPYVKWASKASEFFMMSMFILGLFRVATHSSRFLILYRYFLLLSVIYFLRSVCILVTSVPVPDQHKDCEVIRNSTVWNKLYRAGVIHSALGFKAFGMKTCGDYIFSGHTAIITMTNLFISYYGGKFHSFVCVLSWFFNIMGVTFILLCRGHYTIDTAIAFLLAVSIFSMYHLALKNKNDLRPDCRTFCGTCARIFHWLEPSKEEKLIRFINQRKQNLE